MNKKAAAFLTILIYCFTVYMPVINVANAAATSDGEGISRVEMRRQFDERRRAEVMKKSAEVQKWRQTMEKRKQALKVQRRQKSAVTEQKVKTYFHGHPFRVYSFIRKNYKDDRFKKFFRTRKYRQLRVMYYEKWLDLLGIDKFNEMVENNELVEDNSVLVNAEGKIVGLADDTLEEGTVALDGEGNTIPVVSDAAGAYNPAFQFMCNGKIYDHGYYRGSVNDMLRIMPSAKWIDYIGMEQLAQKIDANEITLDGTGFYDDEGRIIAISDLSLNANYAVFDEFNRFIPNVARYQIPDPVDAYGYFHWRNWKCKHGFYMGINKGVVLVMHSGDFIEELGAEYFAKAMMAELLYRIEDGDVFTDLNGKILAIHQNLLPKEALVIDKDGNKIQVLHDGETYQSDVVVTEN